MKQGLRDWYSVFWSEVRRNPWADGLRDAALSGRLRRWTELLTGVVAKSCAAIGLQVAARRWGDSVLPVPRQEYLGVDLLAFPKACEPGWKKPVLAFELENQPETDIIAYALWKICMVRVQWGGVFCYRREPEVIRGLLQELTEGVMKAVQPEHDVLLVVGTRSRAGDFPDGFFRPYHWDKGFQQFRIL
jgi:hypothetical protein